MATPETVTVIYPAVVNGEMTTARDAWPRERVIAKLDGSKMADALRSDPKLAVAPLMNVKAISLWLGPDRFRELIDEIVRLEGPLADDGSTAARPFLRSAVAGSGGWPT